MTDLVPPDRPPHWKHLPDPAGAYLADCPDCNLRTAEMCPQCWVFVLEGHLQDHLNSAHWGGVRVN